MKTFRLAGENYQYKEMDYNMICDLEEMGVPLAEVKRLSMSFLRAYISLCIGGDTEEAGKKIQRHIVNGGNFEEVFEVLKTAMDDSDFFRALKKDKDTDTRQGTETERAPQM